MMIGDPLIDPKRPQDGIITPFGIVCLDPKSFDLFVQIEGRGYRAWVRDNEECTEPFFGRDWKYETKLHSYSDLVHWAYTW